MSKDLAAAVASAAGLPIEQQQLLAAELLEHIRRISIEPYALRPAERIELEAELVAARRGELATVA